MMWPNRTAALTAILRAHYSRLLRLPIPERLIELADELPPR